MIVDGDPAATGTDVDCFPPAIHQHCDTDGNQLEGFVDPMAADVRQGADGKHLAKLKIIAGILGMPLDELAAANPSARQQLDTMGFRTIEPWPDNNVGKPESGSKLTASGF